MKEPYALINIYLYNIRLHDIIHSCTLENEHNTLIEEAHYGLEGGHFHVDRTTRKILPFGLWWPALHKY